MTVLQAVEAVLAEAGSPLRCHAITDRVLAAGHWQTKGKTPEATVHARLVVDIKDKGTQSRFQRTEKGVFALRAWGLPEYAVAAKQLQAAPEAKGPGQTTQTEGTNQHGPAPVSSTLSFTDAAEQVLKQYAGKKPMHYKAITEKALQLGLITTAGKTPEATLYAQIITEIVRVTKRGNAPRFMKLGKGLFGLTVWLGQGLAVQIEQQNAKVRQELLARLQSMAPPDFEALVGRLLGALGFDDVTVTRYGGDGGIDVRGLLVVGDVIRTRMAVQVKRWKNNVQTPTVQQVRGSLGVHEQGLIITTGNFSAGAREEAQKPNAVPVALMTGEQLAALLVEYDIGVRRSSHDLIELGEVDQEQEG